MGDITSLVNTWLSNRRTKQTIRNIEKNNELRRNITRYEPSDIEGFIERDANVGSYIISGGNIACRAKAAASVAACSLEQNIPVIILHEGDKTFESAVTYATSFTNNKVIITSNTAVYDPFYNRANNEICNLILNSCNQSLKINASGQQYTLGIAEFIKSKNIPPYCEMFVSCPHDEIFEKIDEEIVKIAERFNIKCILVHPDEKAINYSDDLLLDKKKITSISPIMEKKYGIKLKNMAHI